MALQLAAAIWKEIRTGLNTLKEEIAENIEVSSNNNNQFDIAFRKKSCLGQASIMRILQEQKENDHFFSGLMAKRNCGAITDQHFFTKRGAQMEDKYMGDLGTLIWTLIIQGI
ncbi:hypothetical protein ACJX0J_018048 [Zea mays]